MLAVQLINSHVAQKKHAWTHLNVGSMRWDGMIRYGESVLAESAGDIPSVSICPTGMAICGMSSCNYGRLCYHTILWLC